MELSYSLLNLSHGHVRIYYSFYVSVCVKMFMTKKKVVLSQNKLLKPQPACFLLKTIQEYEMRPDADNQLACYILKPITF